MLLSCFVLTTCLPGTILTRCFLLDKEFGFLSNCASSVPENGYAFFQFVSSAPSATIFEPKDQLDLEYLHLSLRLPLSIFVSSNFMSFPFDFLLSPIRNSGLGFTPFFLQMPNWMEWINDLLQFLICEKIHTNACACIWKVHSYTSPSVSFNHIYSFPMTVKKKAYHIQCRVSTKFNFSISLTFLN